MLKKNLRLILFAGILVTVITVYLIYFPDSLMAVLNDTSGLQRWLRQLESFGPFMIIGLMVLAIVMSPIPSAPIALASGALYGHYLGTIYVVIGAELGAMIAFLIARLLGVDLLQKWFKINPDKSLLGSQNALMGIMFVSRLMPFISFDVMSYAAGLTALTFWRFALATFAGIIPASFLLAHFGSEIASEDLEQIALTVLLLGMITLVPFIGKWLYDYIQKRKRNINNS